MSTSVSCEVLPINKKLFCSRSVSETHSRGVARRRINPIILAFTARQHRYTDSTTGHNHVSKQLVSWYPWQRVIITYTLISAISIFRIRNLDTTCLYEHSSLFLIRRIFKRNFSKIQVTVGFILDFIKNDKKCILSG